MGRLRKENRGREIVINSDFMKIVVASYYRFKRRYIYTCTEYDYMDVCACNGHTCIEVECKISKADLKKEKDKEKHKYYSGEKQHKRWFVPNQYYIAITQKMYKDPEVVEFIKNLNPHYGIMVVDNWIEPYFVKYADNIKLEKTPDKIIKEITLRLSSENIGLRKKNYELKIDKKKDEK